MFQTKYNQWNLNKIMSFFSRNQRKKFPYAFEFSKNKKEYQ